MSERRVIVISNHATYGMHGTLQHDLNKEGKVNIVNLDKAPGAICYMTEELMLESEFNGTLPEKVNVVLQTEAPSEEIHRVVISAPQGKRGRKQTTFDITPEIVDNALNLAKKEGKGQVEIAKLLNVNPTKLGIALQGLHEFKRGRKPKQADSTPSVEVEGDSVLA